MQLKKFEKKHKGRKTKSHTKRGKKTQLAYSLGVFTNKNGKNTCKKTFLQISVKAKHQTTSM